MRLELNQTVRIDVAMVLGQVSQRMEVVGTTPLLQTQGAPEVVGVLAAGLAGLVVLTWLCLVGNLWLGLTGRRRGHRLTTGQGPPAAPSGGCRSEGAAAALACGAY